MSDPIHLHVQAERCFRLARGSAGPKLAEEREALGRAFRQEARELEEGEGEHQSQFANTSYEPACRIAGAE
jgi:hypothetical protein